MDLSFSTAEDAFRAAVRSWLAEHVPADPLPSMDTAEGFEAHRRWERQLFEERYSVVSWPTEYGGRGASITEWLVFEEEYWAAGAPGRVSQNGINLLAPSMLDHGTDAQKARFLPAMASAEQIWAQVWSEPEAGSDLASLRSTAVRAPSDDGWLLAGQKTWSSRASFADWGFGLFRSDPAAERHRGLTYFLFPLTAPGITVRPIPQFDGEPGFAELFFDDVYVPDTDVLGGVGDGWKVTMATAGKERGLYLRSPGRYMATAARLVALWKAAGRPAEFQDRVAEAWIGARAYQLATFETAARIADGGTLGAETSVNKLFWSELDLAMHETALDLLGPDAEKLDSAWMDGYLFALAGPIYAGTNEVQRNVVAERVLGLPRGAR
ncbi:acyl-CoA dehydrogenase domain protein [Catenulispora acidiphila DSM 44928]|uniref:Acyl-CoA dehydrogenase domain protein n=1 Tax=Catenulispora acidiphila (strain DSM 44928 / JCM 14897 / NBRC 102108 / NRRL B-24433 / ID139908) TaxID=479433 RepID=C7Q8M4_CATAD|nr:acyl-CoA dehydrogenase family protein [Catenulispora acidiphila]ACU70289.1 acyl-CoA dehydrogenase domain protein [Catenulispora acidiphila DSM 44928]